MIELNKYPLSEMSSMILDDAGYMFPRGLMLDANITPHCENNPPYNITAIKKEEDGIELLVVDRYDVYSFSIYVNSRSHNDTDYIYGICKQQGVYCGTCIFSKDIIGWVKATENVSAIPKDSLIFAASVIHPTALELPNRGKLIHLGEEVKSVTWGDNMTPSGGLADTDEGESAVSKVVKSLVINGIPATGENVYITPTANSIIRVSNNNNKDISIGRVDEL